MAQPSTTKRPASGKTGARREELLRVAARVFARKGFANATVRDLGEEGGILSGSLYYHFESKDAILEDLLRSLFEQLEAGYQRVVESEKSATESVVDLLKTGFGFLADFPDEIRVLHNDYAYLAHLPRFAFVDEHAQRLQQLWVTVLVRGVDAGEFRQDLEVELAYRTMMGSLLAAVRWFDPAGPSTAEEMGARTAELFLDGLKSPPK